MKIRYEEESKSCLEFALNAIKGASGYQIQAIMLFCTQGYLERGVMKLWMGGTLYSMNSKGMFFSGVYDIDGARDHYRDDPGQDYWVEKFSDPSNY